MLGPFLTDLGWFDIVYRRMMARQPNNATMLLLDAQDTVTSTLDVKRLK